MQFSDIKYITLLCNHHHHPSPELFSSCKTETLDPLNIHSPLPQAPGNHILLTVSMNVTILGPHVK